METTTPREKPPLVMKFGGTSVASAERIAHAASLVVREPGLVVVVTSAMGGVTDELIRLGEIAVERRTSDVEEGLEELRQRHLTAAQSLLPDDAAQTALRQTVEALLTELEQLLHGVSLLHELSPRSMDLLVSFGERLCAPMLAAAVARAGSKSGEAVDARELILTTEAHGTNESSVVDVPRSRALSRSVLLERLEQVIPVVTGFIARTPDGHTTTLGRGGSDYTASLIGSFLDAAAIWIWTDVDGVMTADPRIVPEARVLPSITYREAAEMAYFGSKVLHPSTMIPAVQSRIPVRIRNTFNPDHLGTLIAEESAESALGVKSVTSVADLALITVEGNGMVGVPGVARRVFASTAEARVNVYMVSQASSEHNISFVVGRRQGPAVVRALERQFELELSRGLIDRIDMITSVGILAVIGEGMKGTPGIAQRLFTALGRGRINVLAIAQGSSELNLSVVVRQPELRRAVGAAHSRFGLTRDTHLLLFGKGLVGRTLLRQIVEARSRLATEHGVGLQIMGICGRREMLFEENGVDDERLRRVAEGVSLLEIGGEERPSDSEIFQRIGTSRWLDVVLVDATAEDNGALHAEALGHGLHVVTANKKPMSGPLHQYRKILDRAAQHGLEYHFETTFAAGLPALSTLRELIGTCDEVNRVTGCFSGTLGYLCAAVQQQRRFSEAVREAAALGFTEPDPRDDLNGLDVARKGLIIARQLGAKLELSDVTLEGMATPELLAVSDREMFLRRIEELDEPMASRARMAAAKGNVLRFLAEITASAVSVGLREVSLDSPTGQLTGPDNILIFETDRYREQPLIIRGPGAGAEVTAAGVLGDILKIVRAS